MKSSDNVLQKLVAREVQKQLQTFSTAYLDPLDVCTYTLNCLPAFGMTRYWSSLGKNPNLDIQTTVGRAIEMILRNRAIGADNSNSLFPSERDLYFILQPDLEEYDDDIPTAALESQR